MTIVSIHDDRFHIDGEPTYLGRSYGGYTIEGLLMNMRTVQAIFDDENPDTRHMWAYPDTGEWDAERNLREYLEALPIYRQHGLLAVTLNLQGGNPRGYIRQQPWRNNAFTPEGELKPAYLARLKRVLDRLDELGMVAILGVYYFGQDEYMADEAAVVNGLDNAVNWVLDNGYQNVLLEVNNECDVPRYEHEILTPTRVHELIVRVKKTVRDGRSLLTGVSYGGGRIPHENVVRASDFLLIHGNGVEEPGRIVEMVDQCREAPGYRPMPILFNEDDHFDFDKPMNNFVAAVSRYASWGYLDCGEGDYKEGHQSPPVNWGLSSDRKRGFARLLKKMTDSQDGVPG